MYEHLEFISVVPIQTILSPEPDESLIVLYDLSNLGLGQSLSGGQPENRISSPSIAGIRTEGGPPRRISEEAFVEAITVENDGDKGISSNANAEIRLHSGSVGRRIFRWQSCTRNSSGQAISNDFFQASDGRLSCFMNLSHRIHQTPQN